VIVPAAGVTHAASGIGEAYLDGIPMLVIAGASVAIPVASTSCTTSTSTRC